MLRPGEAATQAIKPERGKLSIFLFDALCTWVPMAVVDARLRGDGVSFPQFDFSFYGGVLLRGVGSTSTNVKDLNSS